MKTIKRGEVLPFGLFRIDEGWYSGPLLALRLPIWLWHRRHFDISSDSQCFGWCALNILLKRRHGGFDVRFGWSLCKATSQMRSMSGLGG